MEDEDKEEVVSVVVEELVRTIGLLVITGILMGIVFSIFMGISWLFLSFLPN